MQQDAGISAIRQLITIILHTVIFIQHARNGHISTSSLKSDITVVFLHPDFLTHANISAIHVHLRQI